MTQHSTRDHVAATFVVLVCACFSEAPGSESGGTSGETTASTSAPTTTSSATSSTSEGPSDTSSSDGSETTEVTVADETTTTGVPDEDYALAFDGTSYARSVEGARAIEFPATDYTVELWAEIRSTDARGVILDTTNEEFTSGWVFYLHNDARTLVFSFFDEAQQNQVIMGPAIEDIGTGWHHLAATKSGTSVSIHVDGALAVMTSVPSSMSFDATMPWSLGGNSLDNPDFRLTDVAIDDVRITGFARYEADFEPPTAYDTDITSVIVLLLLDDGRGADARDENGNLDFLLVNPMWVAGNAS